MFYLHCCFELDLKAADVSFYFPCCGPQRIHTTQSLFITVVSLACGPNHHSETKTLQNNDTTVGGYFELNERGFERLFEEWLMLMKLPISAPLRELNINFLHE